MSECAKCGSPMQDGQDWCLQCGAGKPKSLGVGPGWRTGVAILGATAVLVGGAAVAAYAALNKPKPKPAVIVVAKTPTVAPTATPSTPGATPTPGTPTTVKAATPKIPLQTPTPKSSSGEELFPPETKTTKTPTTTTPTKTSGESTKSPTEGSGSKESETKSTPASEAPSPILLDTNAASVYNPYSFPTSMFGDPSLAIDGEEASAWTAQVQATVAPRMAEGLVLDLKEPQKLGSAKVKTTSIGVTVEIYGANGSALPTTISAPAWARVVGLKVLTKKSTTLKLKTKGKNYRYILLWLAKAPPSSTEAAPGTVSINELELFPPSS
ncbi:MAG TPA: hypothetical protein VIJ33_04690 [Solirubrobacteraceae bacterium]